MNKIDEKELHELFKGIKAEDTNSFNGLYERYYNLVYRIVFSMLKNKENSEDVSQNIFSKIYQLPKEKLPEKYEASWLYTVSKNETLQFIRRIKNEASIDDIYDVSDSCNNIEEIIDVETYKSMLSGLSDKEKEIVSLKVLSQFTFKKIGQMLNMSTPTVQWSYYKAVNSLKISISSLAGFVLTFILGIFTTKLQKNETRLEQKINNIDKLEEQRETDVAQEFDNKGKMSINNYANEQNILSSDATETIVQENIKIDNKVNIGFFSISSIFFIIFIIFFKNYQQKRKHKASK